MPKTQTTAPADILATFTNQALADVLSSFRRPCRDGQGNLRDLTVDEVTFIAATRTEAKARGLI